MPTLDANSQETILLVVTVVVLGILAIAFGLLLSRVNRELNKIYTLILLLRKDNEKQSSHAKDSQEGTDNAT